jgi:dTDP-4-amino-4,6-dideoxygalactose transaminase
MDSEIPFIRPDFPPTPEFAEDYARILASNRYTNFGPFEEQFAERIGSYLGEGLVATTFANATLGLMAALEVVLGRGDGTQGVLVPSFTFAAGPASLEWLGYVPVFIDIEPDGLQPNVSSAQAALDAQGGSIAGVLLCNSFGIGNPQIDAWIAWAQEHHLPVVLDSAAGFGSRYADGTPVGRAGIAEVFSFHATKPFAIGEGGAVVTHDPEIAQRLKSFQNFGFSSAGTAESLGLNAKLPEFSAAIGLRQFSRFDELLEQRRTVIAAYMDALTPLGCHFPSNIETSSGCFASVSLPPAVSRKDVLAALHSHGIGARSYYSPAVHRHPHFASVAQVVPLPYTEAAEESMLSLPIHADMDPKDLGRIIDVVSASLA